MALKIQRDDQATINLTPLIDIVFLLIIFFMVGTRFSELNEAEKNIALNVPEVAEAKALTDPPAKKVVNVTREGNVLLDQTPVTLGQLRQQLAAARQQYPETGVVVRGDAESLYQHVADVIATCRQAEITDLNISVRVADQGSAKRK